MTAGASRSIVEISAIGRRTCMAAAMRANRELGGHWFKDGFNEHWFRNDWRVLREPLGTEAVTMFFYLHGNLALARRWDGRELKLRADQDADLLESIFARWTQGDVAPLYVSEATAQQKRQAIAESAYLRAVEAGPMSELGESVVIYGWAAGEQDEHVLTPLRAHPPARLAVSVFRDDQVFALRAARHLADADVENVVFFDAESPGCWIHPPPFPDA